MANNSFDFQSVTNNGGDILLRVFRQTYKDRNGKTKKLARWYLGFVDHRGRPRKMPGFPDKSVTEELGRRIERLIGFRKTNTRIDSEAMVWLNGLSREVHKHLIKLELIDGSTVSNSKPLICPECKGTGFNSTAARRCGCDGGGHVAAFQLYLIGKENTPQHVTLTIARIKAIIKGCGFTYAPDIDATKVQKYLVSRRSGKKGGISAESYNHYLRAIKGFCRWMEKHQQMTQNPVDCLEILNTATDRRRERRSLTPEEVIQLLEVTLTQPPRYGLTGPEREMLYKTALETGFRKSELGSITRSGVILDDNHSVIVLDAKATKNRKVAKQSIRPEFAQDIKKWLEGLPEAPETPLWQSLPFKSAKMLREDLEAARAAWIESAATPAEREERAKSDFLAYRNAAGEVADFHSLRHTFVTLLILNGASPKLTQVLARHADFGITMKHYSHTRLEDEAKALNLLPKFTRPTAEAPRQSQKTGDMASDMADLDATSVTHSPPSSPDQNRDSKPRSAIPQKTSDISRDSWGVTSGAAGTRTLNQRIMSPGTIAENSLNQGENDTPSNDMASSMAESSEVTQEMLDLAKAISALPPEVQSSIAKLTNRPAPPA